MCTKHFPLDLIVRLGRLCFFGEYYIHLLFETRRHFSFQTIYFICWPRNYNLSKNNVYNLLHHIMDLVLPSDVHATTTTKWSRFINFFNFIYFFFLINQSFESFRRLRVSNENVNKIYWERWECNYASNCKCS